MSDTTAPNGWELTITAEAEVIPGPTPEPDETGTPNDVDQEDLTVNVAEA